MAKPKNTTLSAMFTNLVEATHLTNVVWWIIFSDDQICGGNVGDRSFAFNADISSNDSAQDVFSFSVTAACLAQFNKARALGLIGQCLAPIRVCDPCNPALGFLLSFEGPFEGSGTVLTTILNHIGSFGVAWSALYHLAQYAGGGLDEAAIRDSVRYGGACVGHELTVEMCGDVDSVVVEKLQFLKHSPVWCPASMSWQAMQNLGTVLRSLGLVEQDLTYQKVGLTSREFEQLSAEQRCDLFLGHVVAGFCHMPNGPCVDGLRARFPAPVSGQLTEEKVRIIEDDAAPFTVDPLSICKRYDLDLETLMDLDNRIRSMTVGEVVYHRALTAIYNTDYGL
jgi:hypothetical protein